MDCPYLKIRGVEEKWYYCELKESYCTMEYDWDPKCEVYENWRGVINETV